MAGTIYGPGEIAALGEAIYREHIQPRVGSVEKGKFVVIDVETGDYEVDADDAAATRRLLKRRPDAVTYGVRVGYRAAYRHVDRFGPGRASIGYKSCVAQVQRRDKRQ